VAITLRLSLLTAGLALSSDASATRELEATERYELSNFTYWHYDHEKCGDFAYVKDSDHYVYFLHLGSYIGKNDGRVVKITQRRIEIVELYPDGHGGWVERATKLTKDYDD
jgi:type IV pilus assembly protein PilP